MTGLFIIPVLKVLESSLCLGLHYTERCTNMRLILPGHVSQVSMGCDPLGSHRQSPFGLLWFCTKEDGACGQPRGGDGPSFEHFQVFSVLFALEKKLCRLCRAQESFQVKCL